MSENISGKDLSSGVSGGSIEVIKEYRFEAAHLLTKVPPKHKCARLHGHSFRFEVRVGGEINPDMGWVIDFGDISAVVKPLVDILDHNYLNEIPGLENPTSERISLWLWERIKPSLPGLREIVVHETCTARCSYRG